jgi:steroid delta-isomerase-like uncharacterized protein
MKHFILLSAFAIFFASCMNNKNMSLGGSDVITKNKAGMQAFFDKVFNAHNPAMVDSFCAASFVEHTPAPGQGTSRDDLKKFFAVYFAAFPDIHATVNFMVADTDKVVAHFTITGTNSGPMMGMPATNKKINVDGIDIVTLKNGMATEHWGYRDEMKMMQQLGMMPDSGKMMDDKAKMMDGKK